MSIELFGLCVWIILLVDFSLGLWAVYLLFLRRRYLQSAFESNVEPKVKMIEKTFGLKGMDRKEIYFFCETRLKALGEIKSHIQRANVFFLLALWAFAFITLGEWFLPLKPDGSFSRILIIGILANGSLLLVFFLFQNYTNIQANMIIGYLKEAR